MTAGFPALHYTSKIKSFSNTYPTGGQILAAFDDLFIPEKAHSKKISIDETGRLMQSSHQKDGHHCLDHSGDGAPAASDAKVAHVNVPKIKF